MSWDDFLVSRVNNLSMDSDEIQETFAPEEAWIKCVAQASYLDIDQPPHGPRCHPDILTATQTVIGANYSAPISWVHSDCVNGRTTFMKSLAESMVSENKLAASFFFSKTSTDDKRRSSRYLITTIAHQLSLSIPSLRPFILDSLGRHPEVLRQSATLQEQVKILILQPFERHARKYPTEEVPSEAYPRTIIVDGLDDCGSPEEQLRALTALRYLFTGNEAVGILTNSYVGYHALCLIIGTRTDRQNDMAITTSWMRPLRYHLPSTCIPDEEIRQFLNLNIEKLKKIHPKQGTIPPDWPASEDIDVLVERSVGELVYAGVALRYMLTSIEESPVRCLKKIVTADLGPDYGREPLKYLAMLYNTILYEHFTPEDNEMDDYLRLVGFYLFSPPWCKRRPYSGSLLDISDLVWAYALPMIIPETPERCTLAAFHELVSKVGSKLGAMTDVSLPDKPRDAYRVPSTLVDSFFGGYMVWGEDAVYPGRDLNAELLHTVGIMERWVWNSTRMFAAYVETIAIESPRTNHLTWLLDMLRYSFSRSPSNSNSRNCVQLLVRLSMQHFPVIVHHVDAFNLLDVLAGSETNRSTKWIRQVADQSAIPRLSFMLDQALMNPALPRELLVLSLCADWCFMTTAINKQRAWFSHWTEANCPSVLTFYIHEKIRSAIGAPMDLGSFFPDQIPTFDPFGCYGHTSLWNRVAVGLRQHMGIEWFSPADYASAALMYLGRVQSLTHPTQQPHAIFEVEYARMSPFFRATVSVGFWNLLMELLPRCQLSYPLVKALQDSRLVQNMAESHGSLGVSNVPSDYIKIYYTSLSMDPLLMTDPTISASDVARQLKLDYLQTLNVRLAVERGASGL